MRARQASGRWKAAGWKERTSEERISKSGRKRGKRQGRREACPGTPQPAPFFGVIPARPASSRSSSLGSGCGGTSCLRSGLSARLDSSCGAEAHVPVAPRSRQVHTEAPRCRCVVRRYALRLALRFAKAGARHFRRASVPQRGAMPRRTGLPRVRTAGRHPAPRAMSPWLGSLSVRLPSLPDRGSKPRSTAVPDSPS